jgi:hypothetical protein
VNGDSGVLLDNTHDLAAYGAAVTALLEQPEQARQIGERARERVSEHFVSVRSLLDYLEVIRTLVHVPAH